MEKPEWLTNFERYDHVHELKGRSVNPVILDLLDRADGTLGDGKTLQNIHDDETPYCSSALCGNFEELGYTSPRNAMARSWEHWGVKLDGPAVGAIVVFWRGASQSAGQGHVGLVCGKNAANPNQLIVYGANQGDSFKHEPFNRDRVVSYRWPDGEPLPTPENIGMFGLPLLHGDGTPTGKVT